MSTVTNPELPGIRDPYRSLLILLGGALLALLLLIGQAGYQDDAFPSGQNTSRGGATVGRLQIIG